MVHLTSPIKAINELRIEPMPTDRAVEVKTMTQINSVNRCLVALGTDGKVYSNNFRQHAIYPLGCDMTAFLRALQRLKVIRAKDVNAHLAAAKQHNAKLRRFDDVDRLKDCCRRLGIKAPKVKV